MVVKIRKEAVPRSYVLNAGVAIFFVTTTALVLRSAFTFEELTTCGDRYTTMTALNLTTPDGQLKSRADIQADLGSDDWGLYQNLSLLQPPGGEVPAAMKIALAGEEDGGTSESKSSGVGYRWLPRFIEDNRSACLTYKVFLPESFEFSETGYLPGLRVEGFDAKDQALGITYPVRWKRSGHLGMQVKRDGVIGRPREHVSDAGTPDLSAGRWIRIDKEIRLNEPGKADGLIRFWVNGRLRIEVEDALIVPEGAKASFVGVVGDTHYTTTGSKWRPAPKDTSIALSEIKLRVPGAE
ncbi:MAG: polysaccharide lyase [Pseudomonadota bacterium]